MLSAKYFIMSDLQYHPILTQQKRLACQRCHAQKLRCLRDAADGPCARCQKAETPCIFGPSLRVGRPFQQPGVNVGNGTGNNTRKRRRKVQDMAKNAENVEDAENADKVGDGASEYSNPSGECPVRHGGADLLDSLFVLPGWPSPTAERTLTTSTLESPLTKFIFDNRHTLSFQPGVGGASPICTTEEGPASRHPLPPTASASDRRRHIAPAESSDPSLQNGRVDPDIDLDGPWDNASLRSLDPIDKSQLISSPLEDDPTELCLRQLSELNLSLYRLSRTVPSPLYTQIAGYHGFDAPASAPTALTPQMAIDDIFNASRNLVEILSQYSSMQADMSSQSNLKDPQSFFSDIQEPSHHNPSPSSTVATDSTSASLPIYSPLNPSYSAHLHDGPIILQILSCYFRLLSIYNALCVAIQNQLMGQPQLNLITSCLPSPIMRFGSFVPPSSSAMELVFIVSLVAHFLDRIDKAIGPFSTAATCSRGGAPEAGRNPEVGEGEDGGKVYCYGELAETSIGAMKEQGKSLRANLKRVKWLLKQSTAL